MINGEEKKLAVSIKMTPSLIDLIDGALADTGDNILLFEGGMPNRSEFMRKAMVMGIKQMRRVNKEVE